MGQLKRVSNESNRSRSWIRLAGVLLIATALGLWGWRTFGRSTESTAKASTVPPIDPPQVATEGVDPAVIAAINQAAAEATATPHSDQKWGQLGMVLAAHEFDQQAQVCYQQAAALNPNDAKWPYLNARTMLLTVPEQSVPLLLRSVELCGNTPTAPRLTLVETLLELYRLEEADEQLLLFEADYGADPRARFARARLAFLRNDVKTCLDQLKTLTSFLMTQPRYRSRMQPLLLLMAECHRREGEVEKAEQLRKQGLTQSSPSWPDPYQKLVSAKKTGLKAQLVDADRLFGQKKYDESIAMLEQVIEVYPDSIWARILLGRALIRTGAPDSNRPDRRQRLERAMEVLQNVLDIDQNSVEAIFRLAVAKGYAMEREEAAQLYQKAVKLKPDFTMAHYNLALNYRERGRIEEAVEAMERATQAEPDFIAGHAQLGDMMMRAGRYDEAVERLQLAVKLSPRDPRLQSLLARARQLKAATQPVE